MAEKPVQNQESLSDEAAKDYIDYYLVRIGSADVIDSLPKYDRRIMADIPLTVQMDPLHVPERPHSHRDKLVSYFENNNWLPKQLQEANIAAIKGVDRALRRARESAARDPIEAQIDTHATIKRYYNNAVNDVRVLNSVRSPNEAYDIEPDIDALRHSREALYTLAEMLLAKEFLDSAQWPNSNWSQYKERQQYWRGFMLFAADYASDPVLQEVFNHFFEKAQQRRKFWSEQYGEVDKKIGFLVMQESKPNEESVVEKAGGPKAIKPSAAEITSFDELIPEGAQEDLMKLVKAYADQSDQIERYVKDQGMTREQAEFRVLGGKAERYKGYIVGVQKKEVKPDAQTIAISQKPRSNPALKPWIRRQPGYDKRPEK